MAGVAAPNKRVYHQNQALKRSAEVTAADWDDGMNKGGSCAPGMGVNTGDYSPKASDWSEDERLLYESQHVGQGGADLRVQSDDGADVNNNVSFVQTAGAIAPDGELKAATGALNRTGKTVPSGAWCWGEVEQA